MAAGAALRRSRGKLPLGLYRRSMGLWSAGILEQRPVPPAETGLLRGSIAPTCSHGCRRLGVVAQNRSQGWLLLSPWPFSAWPSQRFPSSQYPGREI